MDERVQLLDDPVLIATLLQNPVRSRLDQGQGSDSLRVLHRELQECLASSRPAGEMGAVEVKLVQGHSQCLALDLCRVARLPRLPFRSKLVVDRLNPDHAITARQSLLVRHPGEPPGQSPRDEDHRLALALVVESKRPSPQSRSPPSRTLTR